jgi:hypothetical protein
MRKTINGHEYHLTQQTQADRKADRKGADSCSGCAFDMDDACMAAGDACIDETRPSQGIIMIWKHI